MSFKAYQNVFQKNPSSRTSARQRFLSARSSKIQLFDVNPEILKENTVETDL